MGQKSFAYSPAGVALAVAAGLGLPGAAMAASPLPATPQTVEDLRDLSLDDLTNLKVTSVSRRPEALADAAAAVYVITAEDIRRSGATSLPEALRLAPNLEVARINAYSWTVTARGFNSPETANKLLVLVNGRSVYEPIGGGVLWQQVDVDLANIDHIEVISGPGSTLWGANAVNGIINIIPKDAAATQGLHVEASAGNFERTAAVRYGGRISDHVTYKMVFDAFDDDSTSPADATATDTDAFRGGYGSVGLTGTWDRDTLSGTVSSYDNRIADHGGKFTGSLARAIWSHTTASGASVNLTAIVTHDVRNQPNLYESRDSVVVSAQHAMQLGARQQLILGGEYRYWWEDFVSFNAFHFANPKTNISLGSLFVQDEIALRDNLKLTLGVKGEYNSYSGYEWLPNVRMAWRVDNRNNLWAAVSRSARTPNRIERELEAVPFLAPSPDFQSEKLTALEAGWRSQPSSKVSFSLSAFYNRYDDLRTDGITPVTVFPFILQNGGRGTTYGLEAWGQYAVNANWRLSGGFNLLHKHFTLKPGYFDVAQLAVQGLDPDYQAQLRSEWTLSRNLDFDLTLRRVGAVKFTPVPAYTEANAHLEWHVNDKLSVALDGLNLLHERHLEVWDPSTTPPHYVPRSVFVNLRYGF